MKIWSTPDLKFCKRKIKIWSTPDFATLFEIMKIWSTPDLKFCFVKIEIWSTPDFKSGVSIITWMENFRIEIDTCKLKLTEF